MNVLITIYVVGIPGYELALVPWNLMEEYDLDAINRDDESARDNIKMIFDRLGIYPFDGPKLRDGKDLHPCAFRSEYDLAQYRNIEPPFMVDKMISIILN